MKNRYNIFCTNGIYKLKLLNENHNILVFCFCILVKTGKNILNYRKNKIFLILD